MRLPTALLSLVIAAPALAQSPAFTYQGRLDDNGQPANGTYDIRFTLFDAAQTPVGVPACADNVTVEDGLFTVIVNLGAAFAHDQARLLGIEVRPDSGLSCLDSTGFTELLPRQSITPAPRATAASTAHTLSAPDGSPSPAVSVDNNGRVGVGTTTPLGVLDVRAGNNSHVYVGDANGDLFFNGGTDSFFGFVNNGSTAGRTEFITPTGVAMTITNGNRDIGIGTTAPAAKLHVMGEIRLHSSGNFFAVKSPQPDRMLRGQVNANATVDSTRSSPGFTVTSSVTGTFVINFTTPFASPPVIVATPMGACCKAHVTQTQTTFATIIVQNVSTGAGTASGFQFIVMGS